MAKLRAARRKKLPSRKFGLPKQRKYPVDTKGRARAAKSRASEMEHEGRLSRSQETAIDRAADRKLSQGSKHTEDSRVAGMSKPKAPEGYEHITRSRHFR